MEFGLSQEQTLLTDSVARFLDGEVPLDRVRRFAKEQDDTDIWHGLAGLGVPALLVPESAGGVGLACLDAALVAETLGYHATPAPFLGTAVALPLALAGQDGDELLARSAAGELRVGLALAGAIGRRGSAGVTASGGRLSGTAPFAIDCPADCYLIADDARRLYLVHADAAGLTSAAFDTIDRTRRTGTLTLNGTPARLVSDDPAAFGRVLDAARVMLAADTLGAAQQMLDQAVAYAKQREQFNRPIATFQAVKHMCAEMAAALEPCRAMVWYAAHALDHLQDEAHLTACHTKAHVSEVGKFVAKIATEVHGGMGFTDLVGLHYWFKRIGYDRQMLGTPEQLREEAARAQGLAA
ncbi:MAG: acyl-CoA/acyl-ACP dehydrogenase [Pseudomonadales bacterium]|nr:acyl-CoA/acyl-ACP dehydrogenase [Pseudomonadales bacterium]